MTELMYSQLKDEQGKTLSQDIKLEGELKKTTNEDDQRKKLVELLCSSPGINLPIEITVGDKSQTAIFSFRYTGEFNNPNPYLNAGAIKISQPSSPDLAYISYILMPGKTSSEPTAFITHKGYYDHQNKPLFENKGLMKIAFSLLAEVLKINGIKKVEAHIIGGASAERSRANAPRIFGGGTYADSTEEVEIDSEERVGLKETVLVTTL